MNLSCTRFSNETRYHFNEDHLELKLVQTYGVLSDPNSPEYLYEKNEVFIDSLGNLYVCSDDRYSDSHRLVSFSREGEFLWAVDDMGQGPGELRAVFGCAWNGINALYLGNQAGSRIDRFSLDGGYTDSQLAHFFGSSQSTVAGYVTENELLVLKNYLMGELGAMLNIIDVSNLWTSVDSFVVIQSGSHTISSRVGFAPPVSVVEDHIVVGDLTKYSYKWYTSTGQIVDSLTRPNLNFTSPVTREDDESRTFIKQFSEMYPLVDSEDYYIGGAEWPESIDAEKYRSKMKGGTAKPSYTTNYSLDFFDKEKKTIRLSVDPQDFDIKKVIAVDQDGYIYASLISDEHAIGRFSFKITGSPKALQHSNE